MSVIHLFVGVVYCLVSWSVGLPKRAVSGLSKPIYSITSFFIRVNLKLFLRGNYEIVKVYTPLKIESYQINSRILNQLGSDTRILPNQLGGRIHEFFF